MQESQVTQGCMKRMVWTFGFTLFRIHNNNCSIDFYNKDLQTTIILLSINVHVRTSHKVDWILSELPLHVLSCFSYRMVSSLMSVHDGECFCLREISINVNKFFTLLLFLHFVYVCPCTVVVIACLFIYNPLVRIKTYFRTPLTYVACVNLYTCAVAPYSLKSTSNNKFLGNFPWQIYLIPDFLKEIWWEEVAKEIFSYISFSWRCLICLSLFLYCTVVVACLSLFCIVFVAIFLFIRWTCKQVQCFCFWSFCLSFSQHHFQ